MLLPRYYFFGGHAAGQFARLRVKSKIKYPPAALKFGSQEDEKLNYVA